MSHQAFSGDNPTHFVKEPVEPEREGVIVPSQACPLAQILADFEAKPAPLKNLALQLDYCSLQPLDFQISLRLFNNSYRSRKYETTQFD